MAEIAFREALRRTIRDELLEDERVILMGEDIGAYGGSYAVTKGLLDEFGPERVRDMPISESVIVGCGIGAAMGGLRPMVELMTINFSLLAFDQIVNNAAKIRYMSAGQLQAPMVIRMASGGGSQLGSQHSQSLEGWYAHIPGLKVAVPYTPYDARGLLKTAFHEPDPVIFIEHTALYSRKGEVPDEPYSIPFGHAAQGSLGDSAVGARPGLVGAFSLSSASTNSLTARQANCCSDQSISTPLIRAKRLASASITLASTANPSPPIRPAFMQPQTTSSNTVRRISLSRKRPCRFTENVEWWGTLSSKPRPQNHR